MGELHLSIIRSRLKREFGVETTTCSLRVKRFEIPSKIADHRLYFGGNSNFVHLLIEPDEQIESIRKFNEVTIRQSTDNPMNDLTKQCIDLVNHGIRSALSSGPVNRDQVVNTSVYLLGIHCPRPSNQLSFAASSCVRTCLQIAECRLLAPLAKIHVDLAVKSDVVQKNVLNVLFNRGLTVLKIEHGRYVLARGPLERVGDICSELRSASKGDAFAFIEIDGYDHSF
ncbi:hypothetical protein ACOME3_008910 [Neoechinorhynchus agilis]